METRQERLERENRHFKKQMKKTVHKKNKLKRIIEEHEDKDWRKNIEEEVDGHQS